MTPARYLAIAAAVGIGWAVLLILVADYYENAGMVPMQLLLIAGPVMVPFVPLAWAGHWRRIGTVVAGAMVALGWAYVGYADTRPDTGGGASLAMVVGWAASAVALLTGIAFRLARIVF